MNAVRIKTVWQRLWVYIYWSLHKFYKKSLSNQSKKGIISTLSIYLSGYYCTTSTYNSTNPRRNQAPLA